MPDHLPRQAPAPEVVVQGQVEGHHFGPVAGDGEAGLGPYPQLDLLATELDGAAVEVDDHRAAVGQGGRRRHAVHRAHGRPQLLDPRPQPGAEQFEVGDQFVGQHVAELAGGLHHVHVELLLDHAGGRGRCLLYTSPSPRDS